MTLEGSAFWCILYMGATMARDGRPCLSLSSHAFLTDSLKNVTIYFYMETTIPKWLAERSVGYLTPLDGEQAAALVLHFEELLDATPDRALEHQLLEEFDDYLWHYFDQRFTKNEWNVVLDLLNRCIVQGRKGILSKKVLALVASNCSRFYAHDDIQKIREEILSKDEPGPHALIFVPAYGR
jgi:hypothetical protein